MSLSLSFLAGLLLKMYEKQSWTAEEMEIVQSAVAPATVPPAMAVEESKVEPIVETIVIPKHEAPKKVKKVKKVEDTVPPAAPAAPAPAPAAPLAAPLAPPAFTINVKHCMARMVQKNKPIPEFEDNKVYETKQCIRLRGKGQLLCPKCEEYYTAYKEKSKGKANWEGFINEIPLDNLHVVGSKWFRENYPEGSQLTVPPAPVPSDPAQETILAENAPVIEIKWAKVKIGGIQYIYNCVDRRIYRADLSKEGEDQILWDSFNGKYINGEIDVYAPENEEVPV